MINPGKKLPAAVAAGAFLGAAAPTVAQAEKAPPAHVRVISEKQHLRNEQAKAKVVELAKLIMRGPAARKGGQQNYTNSLTGERFGVAGVDVGVDTVSGTEQGRYTFRISAPLNKHDQLKLNDVTSVDVTEGTSHLNQTDAFFSVDPNDHDAVAFHGAYRSPDMPDGTPGQTTVLDAYTAPTSSKQARLTPTRLIRAISKSIQVVRAAEHKDPAGQADRMQAPFTQPPGTLTGMK